MTALHLFEPPCPTCRGTGSFFNKRMGREITCTSCGGTGINDLGTGRFSGPDPTDTERVSGAVIESEHRGPIKPGKAEHLVLLEYATGERLTAYDASWRCCRDYHARRRESTRLLDRGFLVKDGTLPNKSLNGRDSVDAYRITAKGRAELARLGPVERS